MHDLRADSVKRWRRCIRWPACELNKLKAVVSKYCVIALCRTPSQNVGINRTLSGVKEMRVEFEREWAAWNAD